MAPPASPVSPPNKLAGASTDDILKTRKPRFPEGVRQSRRKSGVSLLTPPGFYALLEFAYLSRLPTRRLSVWVKALQANWPQRKKTASAPENTLITPGLKPTYVSDWRKSVLRRSWLIADNGTAPSNGEGFQFDFRINHYELRCQHWAGEDPNALMLVIFERNTETLCHELIKLSHIQKGRLEKLIGDAISKFAQQKLAALGPLAGAVRFNLPSGKRDSDLYQAAMAALPAKLGPHARITVEYYRSRTPLKFRPNLQPEKFQAASKPLLKTSRIAQRKKLHQALFRFADMGVPDLANFWRSLAGRMNRYFENQPAVAPHIAPCWMDMTRRSVFEGEFSGYVPKKKSKQTGVEVHRDHSGHPL